MGFGLAAAAKLAALGFGTAGHAQLAPMRPLAVKQPPGRRTSEEYGQDTKSDPLANFEIPQDFTPKTGAVTAHVTTLETKYRGYVR
jgi:hypothetical protein